MKKFLIEYIKVIGYVVTGLVFSIAIFVLLVNFYHYKDVNEVYYRGDNAVSAYEKNKGNLEEIKANSNSFDANKFKNNPNSFRLMSIKSNLDMCISKFEETDANKYFAKKNITIKDDYELLSKYQADIVNDCIVMDIYSISLPGTSYDSIKPFVDQNSRMLVNDLDFVKRSIQNNSSYQFSTNYDKTNIFDLTRDSYTKIVSSYDSSVNLVLEVSRWFKSYVNGGV